MIQASLSNLAVVFLMHLCIVTIMNNKSKISSHLVKVAVLFLVSAAVIAMFYLPIQFGGFRFDLRLIPLLFLSTRWGWKLAVPALIITSAWRLAMGGEGSIPGVIFGMALPVFFILFWASKQKVQSSLLSLVLLFSACWLISDLPIIIWLPDGWVVFQKLFLVRYTSFILTALLLYVFILNAENELMMRDKLKYYAEHDPLTGLYNIRNFYEKVSSYPVNDRKKYIVMVDIDHFKSINDCFGHLQGDQILKKVANLILENVLKKEKVDAFVGRYGGEEFILFMAVDSREDMIGIVESIRQIVENTRFHTEDTGEVISITVSVGVAELPEISMFQKAMEQADQCLYASKRNGRNAINYS